MRLQTLSILPVWLLVCAVSALGQDKVLLPTDEWQQAVELAAAHRATWKEVFASLHADAAECEAIIAPELMRYSRLQDGVEQTALHLLYVKGGKERANFSIGMFQMKPSFAEEVEAEWMESALCHTYKLYFDRSNTDEARRRRLARLKDERWQCVYLALFTRLLLLREPTLTSLPSAERVALLATAYNYSFHAPPEVLRRKQHRRTFHLDILPGKGTTYYSYAEIARAWYRGT
jgi:hypothetical protein